MRRHRTTITALALALLGAGCGLAGEPEAQLLEIPIAVEGQKGDVTDMPCPLAWQGDAIDVGALADGRFEHEGNVQAQIGRGFMKYGPFKWSKCESMDTDFFRLQVTDRRFALRARVLGGKNFRLVIWQQRGDGRLVPLEEHQRSVEAYNETQTTARALDDATLRIELPEGTYVVAVVLNRVSYWGSQNGVNNAFYRLQLFSGAPRGTCAQPQLPARFLLNETTDWNKYLTSWWDISYPEFNIEGTTEPGAAPTFFGTVKKDFFNYDVGGMNPNNRVMHWVDPSGDLVAFTREDTSEGTTLNRIDVLDCAGRIIGSLRELTTTGTAYTEYGIYDANGIWVATSVLEERRVDGRRATVFTIQDAHDENVIYAQMTRTKAYQADKWLVDLSMAPELLPIDRRLLVTIPTGKTVANNAHQYGCRHESSADDCADCCIDEGAEMFRYNGVNFCWCE